MPLWKHHYRNAFQLASTCAKWFPLDFDQPQLWIFQWFFFYVMNFLSKVIIANKMTP